jgi:hypothetical protein
VGKKKTAGAQPPVKSMKAVKRDAEEQPLTQPAAKRGVARSGTEAAPASPVWPDDVPVPRGVRVLWMDQRKDVDNKGRLRTTCARHSINAIFGKTVVRDSDMVAGHRAVCEARVEDEIEPESDKDGFSSHTVEHILLAKGRECVAARVLLRRGVGVDSHYRFSPEVVSVLLAREGCFILCDDLEDVGEVGLRTQYTPYRLHSHAHPQHWWVILGRDVFVDGGTLRVGVEVDSFDPASSPGGPRMMTLDQVAGVVNQVLFKTDGEQTGQVALFVPCSLSSSPRSFSLPTLALSHSPSTLLDLPQP